MESGDISTSAHACSSLSAWITVAFRRRRRKNGSKKPIFLTLPCIHKIRFEWWGCLCESCYNVLQIKMTHCILNKHSIDKNSDVQQLTNKIISILILWVWWLKFLCNINMFANKCLQDLFRFTDKLMCYKGIYPLLHASSPDSNVYPVWVY